MSKIDAKLAELGLTLPEAIKVPEGMVLPFSWVRVRGNRRIASGHIALNQDGSVAQTLG